jgi:chemotaxis protein MotB
MSHRTDDGWEQTPPVRPVQRSKKITPRRIAIAAAALAIAGVVVYAFVVRGDRNSARDELAKLRGENKDLANALELHRGKGLDLEGNLTKCQENLSTLSEVDKQKTGLETNLSACRANLKDVKGEAKEAKRLVNEFKAVTGKFQRMIDSGKLDVVFRRGQMIVKLPAAILFPSGSAKLTEQGKPALREVAAILKQMGGRRFTVAGHTDTVPLGPKDDYSSNWELSTSRAVRVTELLIDSGVPAGRLVAAGHGQYDPIASNGTAAGRKKNRRIEIILEPNLRQIATPKLAKKTAKRAATKARKPAPKKK